MEIDRFIEEARSSELLTHTEKADQKEAEAAADQRRIELADQESLALLQVTWAAVHCELSAKQPTSIPFVMVMDANRMRQYDRNRPKYDDPSWKSKRKIKRRDMLADAYAVPAWDMMQRITFGTTECGFESSSMHLGSNGVIYRGLNDSHRSMRTANGTYHGSTTYKSAEEVRGLWRASGYLAIEIDNRAEVMQGLVKLVEKHKLPIDLLKIAKPKDTTRDLGKSAVRRPVTSLDEQIELSIQLELVGNSWEEVKRIMTERNK